MRGGVVAGASGGAILAGKSGGKMNALNEKKLFSALIF